jgi:hypothetical protein
MRQRYTISYKVWAFISPQVSEVSPLHVDGTENAAYATLQQRSQIHYLLVVTLFASSNYQDPISGLVAKNVREYG